MYVATNPANTRVNWLHFLRCDRKDLLILGGAVVLGGVIALFDWRPAIIVLSLAVVVVAMSLSQTRQVFREGDVCPALVVDPGQDLVAVFADLSKGDEPYPAVKILKQPLDRVAEGPFESGARLAFVAMYNGYPREPRWRNFGGYLINTGTTNKKTIKRALRSIPDEQWETFEAALPQLPQPLRPGLYEIGSAG